MKEVKNIQFLTLKAPDKIFGVEKSLLKVFLVPLVFLVLFLISLVIVIVPKVGDIQNNIDKISDLNSQIKLTDQKKAYLSSVDLEQLNQEASLLNKAVLKEKKSYLLVGVIRKIADKFNFQIKSFSVNPGEITDGGNTTLKVSEKETAVRMPVTVTLVGPGDSNLPLIKSLENSLPIMFIDKFDSKTVDGISELNLVVSSYYVPERSDYTSGNLTLNDLRLTDKESELLSTIGNFEDDSGVTDENNSEPQFVEYNRDNPFSL